jgi:hypothetical protein
MQPPDELNHNVLPCYGDCMSPAVPKPGASRDPGHVIYVRRMNFQPGWAAHLVRGTPEEAFFAASAHTSTPAA